ncbi:hypothetical protein V2J09_014470 [Rumex salicifolius]
MNIQYPMVSSRVVSNNLTTACVHTCCVLGPSGEKSQICICCAGLLNNSMGLMLVATLMSFLACTSACLAELRSKPIATRVATESSSGSIAPTAGDG